MTKRQKFHRYLVRTFRAGTPFTTGFTYYYTDRFVPDRLSVMLEEEEAFDFPIPLQVTILSESEEVVLGNGSNIPSGRIHIVRNQPSTVCGKQEGSHQIGLRLLGWLQLKEIQVNTVDTRYVTPYSAPIDIYLKSDGVMVIDTKQVTDTTGMIVEPAAGYPQSGDYIEAINGQVLQDREQLVEVVRKLDGSTVSPEVRRGEELTEVIMDPMRSEEGGYKLGAWMRSDTQGIDTMAYLDLNGSFGALGYRISDSDTGGVVQISNGNLYKTETTGIEKGGIGKPGVMSGITYYGPGSGLGNISRDTEEGIFGTVSDKFAKKVSSEPPEVGYRQDVRKGPAVLRNGVPREIKDHETEIQKVDYSTSHEDKSLVIKVVDEELLQLMDGIARRMSGSPIMQDGKLVGAVTHVFVQDSTKGYGVLIENMLNAGG